jgi:ABC-type branched-subunit amino acid transport system permease subunit
MPQFTMNQTGIEGALAFLAAFMDAPADADIDVALGEVAETGQPAISLRIGGVQTVLSVEHGAAFIRVIESTIREFPSEAQDFANLLLAVREVVRRATS